MYERRPPTYHRIKGPMIYTQEEHEKVPAREALADYSYEKEITQLSQNQIISKLVIPDFTEILSVLTALLINYLVMSPILEMSLFDSYMIIYWGILSLILTMWRWGYSSIYHFMARQMTFEKKLAKGEYIVDFNISGMVFSGLLIMFGSISSGFI